jgi:hypothetical protein
MPWNKTALGAALLAGFFAAAPCWGAEQEIVWSQSDGLRYEIYHSATTEGTWEQPEKLTDNNANNRHPAFAIAPDGTRWIFWSAIRPDGISIQYLVGNGGEWSEPISLDMEDLRSSIAPSVLIDKKGVVWMVWAGNNGTNQDEIYWNRYTGSGWQKPQMINTANQVPDIRPEIRYNKQGQLEVQWQGFREGKYRDLVSVWTGTAWSPEQEFEKEKKDKEEAPVLPDFVPQGSQYVLLDVEAVK